MTIFTESITIIRPGRKRGDYGGWDDDWNNPTEIPIDTPVSIQPAGSDEQNSTTSQLITARWNGFTQPPHLIEELKSGDLIRVNNWPPGSNMWAVAKAEHWRSVLPHTEFALEEINGANRH